MISHFSGIELMLQFPVTYFKSFDFPHHIYSRFSCFNKSISRKYTLDNVLEAYLEPCKTSKMELFAKTIKVWKLVSKKILWTWNFIIHPRLERSWQTPAFRQEALTREIIVKKKELCVDYSNLKINKCHFAKERRSKCRRVL